MAAKDEKCNGGGKTLKNGNCTNPGPDGLPVQCVGPWAVEKHDYLRRYIEATTGPRGKYLVPVPGRSAGGAAFVDLFSGPGTARVRTTGAFVDGSPLIATKHATQPFSKLIFVDLERENCEALEKRVRTAGRAAKIIHGNCNDEIPAVIAEIPPHGLNIALVDPYGLRPLSFDTLRRLASVKRMDLVIHFPTMDIKRNFDRAEAYITRFLGTDRWKNSIKEAQQAVLLIDILREQLATLFNYEKEKVRSLAIKNEQGGVLYHLVFATKDPLGNKIWESIARTDAKGQKDLFSR